MYNFKHASEALDEENLPEPSGYKLLIVIPEVEEKTAGGIYRPDSTRSQEETATIIGQVVAMGTLAYQDTEKFPTGPWCDVGDWIVFRPYSGTRIKVNGREYRLINDDTVEAVVRDLSGVERG